MCSSSSTSRPRTRTGRASRWSADDPLHAVTRTAASQITAVQPGQAAAGAGAVSGAAGLGCVQPRRRVEILSRDAAHRASGFPRAREGLAARRRQAGRSQGRVRLRCQRQPAARRRHRQRFLARDRGRRLYRQAGLSRRRRARRRGRQVPARRGDHRPFPSAAPAHHPLARLGEGQDRCLRGSARRSEGPDDGGDLLGAQGAGQRAPAFSIAWCRRCRTRW